MAYMVVGKPEVITNANGNRTTLSIAAINKKGDGVFEVRSINNKYWLLRYIGHHGPNCRYNKLYKTNLLSMPSSGRLSGAACEQEAPSNI